MDDRELRQLLVAADGESELPPGVEETLLALILRAPDALGDTLPAPVGTDGGVEGATDPPGPSRPLRHRILRRPGAMLAAVLALLGAVLVVPVWWPAAVPAPTIAPIAEDPTVTPREGSTQAEGSTGRNEVTDFPVPFSLELGDVPDRLAVRSTTPGVEVLFQQGEGRFLAFVTLGGDLASWTDRFEGIEGALLSLPFTTEIGGVTATAVDVFTPVEVPLYNTALDGAMWSDLSTRGTGPNRRTDGTDAVRIHVLEVSGQRVSVLAAAPASEFPDWVTRTGEVLDSVHWLGADQAPAVMADERRTGARFVVPFSLDSEAAGRPVTMEPANPGVEEMLRTADGILLLTTGGPRTIEGWRDTFDGVEAATLSEPLVTSVGGAPATAFDVHITGDTEVFLYTTARDGGLWSNVSLGAGTPSGDSCSCAAGNVARIHVLEIGGEVVTALAIAEEDSAAAWLDASTELLATLRWGDVGG